MASAKANTRFIPTNIYETLHFSALSQDGIGAGKSRDLNAPRCVYEHADALGSGTNESVAIKNLLAAVGITREVNDAAVREVNKAKGKFYRDWWTNRISRSRGNDDRISWEEWCEALSVEPSDAGDEGYGEEWGKV